jgi:peptide-methionine (S)-S-oxide reductase
MNTRRHFTRFAVLAMGVLAAQAADPVPAPAPPITPTTPKPTMEKITLGGGCYWCLEAVFQRIKGVQKSVSGFSNGQKVNPTYQDVCEGDTGHAEVIQVEFDPAVLPLSKLLDVFWQAHDPTTLNRQGHDVGTQYRSGIYFQTPEQEKVALESKKKAQEQFKDPIVTEIVKAGPFYSAEAYHQDYYNQNKEKNRYCSVVIWPKLKKLGLELKAPGE